MDTLTKIKIARLLSRLTQKGRSFLGLDPDRVICRRMGVNWDLDLSQGIDLSLYLFRSFEHRSVFAMKRWISQGAVVFDVGANVGAHSLWMAKTVGSSGKVYAFEPTDWAMGKLMGNLALNPSLKGVLEPLQMVLGDIEDRPPAQIHASWNLNQAGDHPIHGGQLRECSNARAATLDQIVDELGVKRVDFIKVDVDGGEFRVLKGASNTLIRFKPAMLIEITAYALEEQGGSLDELMDFLDRCGYGLYFLNGRSPLPASASAIRRLLPQKGGMNALAFPKER